MLKKVLTKLCNNGIIFLVRKGNQANGKGH